VSVKVTLIEPAPPGFHVYSFIRQVRLGLPLLGTLLRDRGHDVVIYVETLGDIDWERVDESDLVGISTITSTAMKAYRYAERAREKGAVVAMGGPHVTFLADEALEFCDYVVRGEGEDTLLELVDHLECGRPRQGILGLSYRDEDGAPVHNLPRPLRSTLEDLPSPDLSLICNHELISPTPILTSRGCAFDCEFCSVIMMFGRRVRVDPPEKIIAAIKDAQPEGIFFYDDNFILSKARTKRLLACMIREGISVPFSAQIRVDSVCKDGRVDHELLHLLREAGCFLVYMGLESVNPATLAAFNKRQSVADIAGGLAALHSYGIKTHGMFVFGSDADTLETLRETTDFAIAHDIASVQFMLLTPLPGTRLTASLEAEGRIFTRNWSLYDGHHVVFWPKNMSPLELQDASIRAHHRFYRLRRWPASPRYRFWGFIISHGWERVPENMAYARELRAFVATHEPPGPPPAGTSADGNGRSGAQRATVAQGKAGFGPNM
jgi:anaerobic magnesium-protoporphyrin IX monomethyl ester cyclase